MIALIKGIIAAVSAYPKLDFIIKLLTSFVDKFEKQRKLKEYDNADKKAEATKDTSDLERMFSGDDK